MESPLSIKTLFAIVIAVLVVSCSSNSNEQREIKSIDQYHEYIAGVTSGVVKRSDPIIIKFSSDRVGSEQLGTTLEKGLLSFTPAIEGTATWVNPDAIEFKPADLLAWNTKYLGRLQLGKIQVTHENLKVMEFSFQTPQKQFTLTHSGLSIDRSNSAGYEIKGEVQTSDLFENAEIEKVLQANQAGDQKLTIKWEHHAKSYSHLFTIGNIVRKDENSTVTLKWDGKGIGAKNSDNTIEITVPSIKSFKVSAARVVNQPDQYLQIVFSDPINADKDYRGFVQIDNTSAGKYKIEYNILKVYPAGRLTGTHKVTINGAFESLHGYKLGSETSYTLDFGGLKPEVKLLGNGVIVPQNEGLYFPFEAVSLEAVDVRILKIFTNNIHAFLQENNFDSQYALNRVGRVVHRSKVMLTNKGAGDLNSWNAFNLDLSKLIEIEPGAIYNVEIGFRKEYSLYSCESAGDENNHFLPVEEEEKYPNYSYRSVFYSHYYNWSKRDDACSYAYFDPGKFPSRNILGSNYGIIAQTEADLNTYIHITNLLTANTEAGVDIKIYDYQNQLINSGSTNGDGLLKIKCTRAPFLIIASKDKQRGYLKIDGRSMQSTSNFDVGGSSVEQGIKGFIYGERDVWRPGDSVFVSFILEDKLPALPQGHPLILEVYNPKGQFVKKLVKQRDQRFIYPFFFKTNQDDPTGNWQAIVKAGAVQFSKTIRIETVKPNRLKVNVQFDDDLLTGQHPTAGTLEAKWLHGSPAANLKAKVDVSFSSYAPKFKDFKDFDFSTPYEKYYGEQLTIFDNQLDENGKAALTFDFKPNKNVTGFLRAAFTSKVFENGGDFSINYFTQPFSPFKDYVGLKINYSYKNWNKLDNDKEHLIEIASVDEKGNPLKVEGIEVKLFELDYRWWYNSNNENLASYSGTTWNKPVFSTQLNTSDGKASFKIKKDENRWGRHLLLLTSPNGHVSGQIIYFGYPWGRGQQKGGAQMLALITENENFKVGEKVKVSFPANSEARALVSIENGSRILAQEWLTDLQDFNHYEFVATPEMAPNVFVHITLIQPHAQTANDLPIRLYGYAPVMVEDPETRLYPEIEMPDELRPLKEFTVKVSEANKKAMDYTIAIVDEGLLDLTSFKTPVPWNTFYAREALGVSSYDLFEFVMGSFGSRLESMFAVGGSDGAIDHSKKKSERFKPVVKVLGPFRLKAGDSNKHTITLPQYVGAVRTMVIAAEKGKYGNTEVSTPVREPLMVLATLPRVLSPDEQLDLPVSVFAMKASVKEITIKIETNDYLQVVGNSDSTIYFDAIGEKDVFFTVKSQKKTGIARLKVSVESGKEKSFYEMELDIRQANLPTVHTQFKLLQPDEEFEFDFTKIGIDGTNKAQIEVSTMPSLNLGRRLKYLITYPHGCIEQVTSSVFPQLYLPYLLDLPAEQKDKIAYNISKGIERLQNYQLPSGSFSYWPGGSYGNEWASCYAGHFLLEAERAGYLVPGNMKSEWLKHLRRVSMEYNANSDLRNASFVQAYRLFMLAMEGEAQISAMNRLRAVESLNRQSKWLLAGAYSLAGMKDVAYQLVDFRNMQPEKPKYYYYYGSELRDESLILLSLLAMDEVEKASELAVRISKKMSEDQWYSTQTTAFALISLAKFGQKTGADKAMEYSLSTNSNTSKHQATSTIDITEFTFDNTANYRCKLKNTGKGALFVNTSNEGVVAGIDTESVSNGLQLVVNYSEQNGKVIDVSQLPQGKDFKVKLTVYNKNASRVENIALSQLFPSGWEIINSRLFGFDNDKKSDFDYQDIRDDRIYTYFGLAGYESKTFTVHLNAAYCGDFVMSPVNCGDMYNKSVFAKVPGQKVSVVKE